MVLSFICSPVNCMKFSISTNSLRSAGLFCCGFLMRHGSVLVLTRQQFSRTNKWVKKKTDEVLTAVNLQQVIVCSLKTLPYIIWLAAYEPHFRRLGPWSLVALGSRCHYHENTASPLLVRCLTLQVYKQPGFGNVQIVHNQDKPANHNEATCYKCSSLGFMQTKNVQKTRL